MVITPTKRTEFTRSRGWCSWLPVVGLLLTSVLLPTLLRHLPRIPPLLPLICSLLPRCLPMIMITICVENLVLFFCSVYLLIFECKMSAGRTLFALSRFTENKPLSICPLNVFVLCTLDDVKFQFGP